MGSIVRPSREVVKAYLEEQGYEYLGPSLPEDDPDYEPPPQGPYELAFLQFGPLVGIYRVRRADHGVDHGPKSGGNPLQTEP